MSADTRQLRQLLAMETAGLLADLKCVQAGDSRAKTVILPHIVVADHAPRTAQTVLGHPSDCDRGEAVAAVARRLASVSMGPVIARSASHCYGDAVWGAALREKSTMDLATVLASLECGIVPVRHPGMAHLCRNGPAFASVASSAISAAANAVSTLAVAAGVKLPNPMVFGGPRLGVPILEPLSGSRLQLHPVGLFQESETSGTSSIGLANLTSADVRNGALRKTGSGDSARARWIRWLCAVALLDENAKAVLRHLRVIGRPESRASDTTASPISSVTEPMAGIGVPHIHVGTKMQSVADTTVSGTAIGSGDGTVESARHWMTHLSSAVVSALGAKDKDVVASSSIDSRLVSEVSGGRDAESITAATKSSASAVGPSQTMPALPGGLRSFGAMLSAGAAVAVGSVASAAADIGGRVLSQSPNQHPAAATSDRTSASDVSEAWRRLLPPTLKHLDPTSHVVVAVGTDSLGDSRAVCVQLLMRCWPELLAKHAINDTKSTLRELDPDQSALPEWLDACSSVLTAGSGVATLWRQPHRPQVPPSPSGAAGSDDDDADASWDESQAAALRSSDVTLHTRAGLRLAARMALQQRYKLAIQSGLDPSEIDAQLASLCVSS